MAVLFDPFQIRGDNAEESSLRFSHEPVLRAEWLR